MKKFKTDNDLFEILKGFSGKEYDVTVNIFSKAKTNKKSRVDKSLFGDVFKADVYSSYDMVGKIGMDYTKIVNDKLVEEGKEPDFEAKKLPWGEYALDNLIIQHGENLYLRAYSENTINLIYKYKNGDLVEEEIKDRIAEFLPPKKSGTMNFSPKNISFNSIQYLKIGDEEYIRGS